ncbi:1-aminocyclopropane-1-carboxylate deaminase/D-cysteine desulfhydrase [Actinocorallia sp. A-T 12471]|uniref:1-aminocyclopropane-1-carboxylate deaminase/D-cysteine desulfhydrase n=1 Tax=Actinocorallia sp. A-T 12471 TaxID=3089813 RepID=UPI0029CE0585|nr:pyridoxal-phosphate dependent enzyme [Actinocorallia sp. A-T 12471]MDX6740085.1 pyridoxal-phosphate dependent enzyme [Actinocorallia sp. A-T 12471]
MPVTSGLLPETPPTPLVPVEDERLGGVRLLVKRDDLIDPDIPGNKWRKLKYNLAEAAAQGHDTLLTFGGAYSNHIRATAAAGRRYGFRTVGIIRGEEHSPLNPVLEYATAQGMELRYVSRTAYRDKPVPPGRFYVLPEGGSNALAVRGCAEAAAEITEPYDYLCCPVGTGGTLAGLAFGLRPGAHALGFAVLKGAAFLADEVRRLQREHGEAAEEWSLEFGFHHGGYARRTPALDAFVADFTARHGIPLDPVYTGKMLYGVYALAAAGRFPPGATVVAVLTGQG